MRRTEEEVAAELALRRDEYYKNRRTRVRRTVLTVVPLVLCAVIAAAVVLPRITAPVPESLTGEEAGNPETLTKEADLPDGLSNGTGYGSANRALLLGLYVGDTFTVTFGEDGVFKMEQITEEAYGETVEITEKSVEAEYVKETVTWRLGDDGLVCIGDERYALTVNTDGTRVLTPLDGDALGIGSVVLYPAEPGR